MVTSKAVRKQKIIILIQVVDEATPLTQRTLQEVLSKTVFLTNKTGHKVQNNKKYYLQSNKKYKSLIK